MWFLVVFNDDTRQKRAMSQGDNKLNSAQSFQQGVEILLSWTDTKGKTDSLKWYHPLSCFQTPSIAHMPQFHS